MCAIPLVQRESRDRHCKGIGCLLFGHKAPGQSQNLKAGGVEIFSPINKNTWSIMCHSYRWEQDSFFSFSGWIMCWKLVLWFMETLTFPHTSTQGQATERSRTQMCARYLFLHYFVAYLCMHNLPVDILWRQLDGICSIEGHHKNSC